MSFYEALLRLYPASFRREYRHELVATFELETRGFGRPRRAAAALADVIPNAIAAHAEILARDLRFAIRSLRRSPGFAITTILIVALGVGANTAAFSLADFVFLRPLPFREPDRLVRLLQRDMQGSTNELSPANYRDWKAASTSFTDMSAWWDQSANLVGAAEPRRLDLVRATPGFLQLLGVQPVMGRLHDTTDVGNGETIILSYALWQTHFGGDPEAIGKVVRLDGIPHTVVAVMPSTFHFPQRGVDAWTQLAFTESDFQDRTDTFLDVVARLRPGLEVRDAQRELMAITDRLARQHPEDLESIRALVYSLRDDVSARARVLVLALVGAALCILLLACANLASLFLARAAHRARELAVRTALGAGSEVLVRQLITESAGLALVGGAAGVLVAWLTLPALATLVPNTLPIAAQPAVDARVLLFAAALVAMTAVLFGVAPAMRGGSANALQALRDSARAGGGRTRRLRAGFVVTEIAASVVLLILSGLLIRAVARVEAIDPGFRSSGVLTLRTALSRHQYDSVARRAQFYGAVLDGVRALPGVQAAAFVTGLPVAMRGGIWGVGFEDSLSMRDGRVAASLRFATPGYFKTMGIPLLAGRDIQESDRQSAPYVAVVSQSLARQRWPNDDPIGKRIWFAYAERTVVGVVGEVRMRGREWDSEPQVYLSHQQVADGSIVSYFPKDLVVRAASAASLLPAIRRIIAAVDPEQPVSHVRMMTQILEEETAPRVAQLRLLAALALIGLLIAGVGIHGLLTYTVENRSQELGVRRALGAQAGGIVQLVLGEGLRLAVVGVVAGGLAAYFAGRAMSAALMGVRPEDPLTMATAIFLCLLVTVIGCVRPALRAARVDPMTALRAE